MSNMRVELEVWRLAQYAEPHESNTEHELRVAFHSHRWLRKHHQELFNPWTACGGGQVFIAPPKGMRVLVKDIRGWVGVARIVPERDGFGACDWRDDNDKILHGITHWMSLP